MSGGRHLLFDGDITGALEDLRFPAQAISPPGPTGAPGRSTSTGLLLFDDGSTELIAGVAQLPHGWLEGSIVYPHIHIRAEDGTDPGAGSNNVVQFLFEWKWYNLDAPTPATSTPDTKNFTLPPHAGGLPVNYMAHFDGISGTGFTVSSMIEWRISRIGGEAADTYGGDCVLVEFDIHYYNNKLGKTIGLPP